MTRRLVTIVITAALLATACGGSDTAVETRLESVGASAFAAAVDEAPAGLVVLDVRTPGEFSEGHIGDAVNIDFYEASFRSDLDGLDKDLPYALYCRSGNRSGQALTMMRELGFTDVRELSGGIVAWLEAGQPIER